MRKLMLLVWGLLMLVAAGAQNPSVSFVVDSQTISEGIGTFQIAVSITNPNATATSVDINVLTGGNAVYGTNFTYSPVTVTFPASSPFTQTFTVTVIDDSIPDGDKFVVFGLANPTPGVTIGSIAQSKLVMRDFDTPKLSIYPVTMQQLEAIGSINVPVSLTRGVRDTTKVQVKLVPGGTTAVKGVDFVFNDTMLVWPPDSAGIINAVIGVINNQFYEPARTVEVSLANPTNGAILLDSVFTLTILANPNYTLPGCSDLFFGQYVEGSGNNKALQIYNPTSVSIDLGVYSILKSVNAGASMSVLPLSGTIPAYGVYVVANPAAAAGILNVANATNSFVDFDGTGALALLHIIDTIDIIGQLYTNPGISGWSAGNGSTVQHTLIRNYYDHAGDTSWTPASSTWDSYPVDMLDSLGFHNSQPCNGGAPVATVRFLRSNDTLPQVLSYDYIVIEVNNPTGQTVNFTVALEPNLTTATNGYGNDFLYTNNVFNSPPGITKDTFWIEIFPRPEITPIKTVGLKFINLSSNIVAIQDSIYMLYMTNNNKFIISFLGAGYSYPKDTGLIEIPLIITTYSSQPTTVDVSLSAGSAVRGQDFLFNDTTITFRAFSLDTQGVWVTIINNNLYERNKQANFDLVNPTNGATLGISGFTLTIINNDSLAGGISQNKFDNTFNIYPNPVSGNLFIQAEKNLTNVEITDLLGNTITVLGSFPLGTSSVNVSSLATGIYLLRIKNIGYCRRFVKIE